MSKNPIKLSATLLGMALVAFTSCEDQDFIDVNNDATRVEVNTISAEMAKVRDYVPPYAVMAHRGSTFWAPEETESAWRWAREMGADYLESDLQCTKDGVILANHVYWYRREYGRDGRVPASWYGSTIPRHG